LRNRADLRSIDNGRLWDICRGETRRSAFRGNRGRRGCRRTEILSFCCFSFDCEFVTWGVRERDLAGQIKPVAEPYRIKPAARFLAARCFEIDPLGRQQDLDAVLSVHGDALLFAEGGDRQEQGEGLADFVAEFQPTVLDRVGRLGQYAIELEAGGEKGAQKIEPVVEVGADDVVAILFERVDNLVLAARGLPDRPVLRNEGRQLPDCIIRRLENIGTSRSLRGLFAGGWGLRARFHLRGLSEKGVDVALVNLEGQRPDPRIFVPRIKTIQFAP